MKNQPLSTSRLNLAGRAIFDNKWVWAYNTHMFKYTAHPEILRKYASIQKNSKRPWDDHYYFAVSITGTSSAYFACGDFWRNYKALEFYSPTVRREVPLNSMLLPAMYFLDTETCQ